MRRLLLYLTKITTLPLLLSLVLIISLHAAAEAQESIAFDIEITPQAAAVVAGDRLVYTVTVTNQSQIPVQNTAINIPVPVGVRFVATRHNNPKWFGGNPLSDPNETLDEIVMLAPEALEPGEEFIFELIVDILPETRAALVIDNYQVTALTENISASGPPVRVEVTPGPTPTPTPTAVATATIATVPATPPVPAAATPQPDQPVARATPAQPTTPVAQPPEQAVTQPEPSAAPVLSVTLLVGLILLLVAVAGAVWFIKK